jgi:hypothetical protein
VEEESEAEGRSSGVGSLCGDVCGGRSLGRESVRGLRDGVGRLADVAGTGLRESGRISRGASFVVWAANGEVRADIAQPLRGCASSLRGDISRHSPMSDSRLVTP